MHKVSLRRAKHFPKSNFNSNMEASNRLDRRGLIDLPVSPPSIPLIDPLVTPLIDGPKPTPPGNDHPDNTPPPQVVPTQPPTTPTPPGNDNLGISLPVQLPPVVTSILNPIVTPILPPPGNNNPSTTPPLQLIPTQLPPVPTHPGNGNPNTTPPPPQILPPLIPSPGILTPLLPSPQVPPPQIPPPHIPPIPAPDPDNPGDGGDNPQNPSNTDNNQVPNPNSPTPTSNPDSPHDVPHPSDPSATESLPSQSSTIHLNDTVHLSPQNPGSGNSPDDPSDSGNVIFTTISGVKTEVTQLPHSVGGPSGNIPTGGGGDDSGGGGGGNGSGSADDPSSHGGLSPGIIAAIVVGILLALALLVFFLRRRAKKRRTIQHTRWLSGGEKGPRDTLRSSFGDLRASTFSCNPEGGDDAPNNKRDSGPFSDTMAVSTTRPVSAVPSTPQMTQLARLADIALPAIAVHSTGRRDTRNSHFSIGSAESDGTCGSEIQWVELRPDGRSDNGELSPVDLYCLPSPISVRPFTPTESWSFPKPPLSRSASDVHNRGSKGFLDSDPFADPVLPPSPTGFAPVEMVTRTFEPKAVDELAVEVGDEVSVLRLFDDGWGKVKVLRRKGSTKSARGLEGLIPIDCLRPKGSRDPLYVDARRVSA